MKRIVYLAANIKIVSQRRVSFRNNIKYVYLDISEGMFNLKKFLKYRDSYEEFNEIKEAGKVGLPCIVINDGEEIIFDYNKLEN